MVAADGMKYVPPKNASSMFVKERPNPVSTDAFQNNNQS